MSRAALLKTKILVPIVVAVIAIVGFGGWATVDHFDHKAAVVPTRPHATDISYKGQNGMNALVLLEKFASVQTKHYSFGDEVTSINGVAGNGPKYWTFYVNGKEASVGASTYITKSTDTITWKLQ